MKPLLSIVIPTKDRYKYLTQLLELIDSFNSSEIEVIVQDNTFDNTYILDYLNKNTLRNVKYFHTKEHLTSIQNFDKAILNSTGEYVCFIGDDDGVVRTIVDCVKWMKENHIETVLALRVNYLWPFESNGKIVLNYSRRLIEFINPIKSLVKTLKRGCPSVEKMPSVYNGIVEKKILNDIYHDYNTFFPGGASADISNGTALCFYVKRFVKINTPLIISGTSENTGGVKDRNKPLSFNEISFISENYSKEWEGDLPQYWFGVFVWPESTVKTLRKMKQETFINYINYNRVFARAYLRHISWATCRKYTRSFTLLCYVIFEYVYNKKRRFFKLLHHIFIQKIRYTGIKNIADAEELLYNVSKKINYEQLKY